MILAEWVFWTSALLVGYAYLGYPAIVWVLACLLPRPVRKAPITPAITVLIAAYNEEQRITDKIENCLALNYPPGLLDLTIVSDGSTDRTTAIVEKYASRYPNRVKLVSIPTRSGKASALNAGASQAAGEILLLADTRQPFEPTAAQALARNFADPDVGAVSGELILLDEQSAEPLHGLGFYWRYEKRLREAESQFGSTVVYTGAISAVRRSLFTSLPKETLVDDLIVPLRVMAKGYRVVFDPAARAVDWVSKVRGREFARKVRTLAGLLQTVLHVRRFVGPLGLRVWWQFLSHKVLRLLVPHALAVVFVASAFVDTPFYRLALLLQIATYGLGTAGFLSHRHGSGRRIVSLPYTFLMLNLAAVVGSFKYLAGHSLDLWPHISSEKTGSA